MAKELNAPKGEHKLLNEKFSFIQPYYGVHSNLPFLSVSGVVKLAYSF